jgi:D-3-phosphoglycerate dehydrogenase
VTADGEKLVLVADPIDPSAVERLRAAGLTVVDGTASPEAVRSNLPRAWALVVRSRTKVTRDLLDQAPGLRLVARAGVGVDNVDVAAATARGVQVANVPAAATASVAELTVAFCLLLVRDLPARIASTRQGTWDRSAHGGELAGKTIGFVGYGRIAREVARRLRPFEVRLLAFDPFVTEVDDGTTLVNLDRLLAESDIVSVHAALTPENQKLLNARRLSQMKPGAFLINVARGGLVDEPALLESLNSGHLAGAALDVFDPEPPHRPGLADHPKVIATPHLGASTREAQRRAGEAVVDEVLRAARGEPLQALVNPPVAEPPHVRP